MSSQQYPNACLVMEYGQSTNLQNTFSQASNQCYCPSNCYNEMPLQCQATLNQYCNSVPDILGFTTPGDGSSVNVRFTGSDGKTYAQTVTDSSGPQYFVGNKVQSATSTNSGGQYVTDMIYVTNDAQRNLLKTTKPKMGGAISNICDYTATSNMPANIGPNCFH